jgi:hypothetical protein
LGVFRREAVIALAEGGINSLVYSEIAISLRIKFFEKFEYALHTLPQNLCAAPHHPAPYFVVLNYHLNLFVQCLS